MSLIGSLEDLGLVDILQIVSLSRKSGMLLLRSEAGDGRIVLRDGLVQGAAIKGEVEDLRSLLIAQGFVDAEGFARAREVANSGAVDLDEALVRACGLEAELLASLRREHVERSVMRMFSWRSGEFSFEIREELSDEDIGLLLPSGLNTQYLAMEATRLGDEVGRSSAGDAVDADDDDMVFSGEDAADGQRANALALATARAVDASDADSEPLPNASGRAAHATAEVEIAAPAVAGTRVPVAVECVAEPGPEGSGTLVAVDANLSTLEWLKTSVDGLFRRVHIFQRRDAALVRIRQYLARGTVPIVVFADASADRRGPDAEGFAARLRGLAPSMPILALRAEHVRDARLPHVDGSLQRPASPSADPDRWHLHAALAQRLRRDLSLWLPGPVTARRRARGVLSRLKGVSERLRDPATQGEVLTLVLDYGAETFGRIAMFMVRDDVAIGMAQRGLPESGGPDDEGMRALCLGPDEMPALFRRVLDERSAVRCRPQSESDRRLTSRLGAALPAQTYAAPIESGGAVVAIVYADDLPGDDPLPDTTAFEIVLHEAGLVLDRAVLERALAERG